MDEWSCWNEESERRKSDKMWLMVFPAKPKSFILEAKVRYWPPTPQASMCPQDAAIPAGVKARQMWGLRKWMVGVQATWGLIRRLAGLGTLRASRRPGVAGTAGCRTPQGQASTFRASFPPRSLRKYLHYRGSPLREDGDS